MDITGIIIKRKSCRTFNEVLISPSTKRELERYISENIKLPDNEIIDIKIIEKADEEKQMKLNYGMIRGNNTYIAGKSASTSDSRVKYGYLMEKVVLKATEMGLSTCWIGYFDTEYFEEITVGNGFEIPGIVIIGYSDDRPTNLDKIVRFSINASKRYSWEKMFFDYKLKTPVKQNQIKEYSDALEMVRLAPSSGNTQPWRIFFDEIAGEFHFFKKPVSARYEEKGLHDIDMGIALSHFEVTSDFRGLSGGWIRHSGDIVDSPDNLQYIMTWKCE